MSVKKLTTQNFETEILQQQGTCLVDFYADWCGPCKMMAPIVEEIAEEKPELIVGKLNVDESPDLAAVYRVMSIPTLLVIKNGEEVARMIGYQPKEDILATL